MRVRFCVAGEVGECKNDIEIGYNSAKELGLQDLGQGVIVENGKVTAQEGEEGTEALIKSATGGILVKCKKPQQEMRVDLPTIGVETIEQLKKSGLVGVAVDSGNSLILDKQIVIEKANEYGIFIFGI